MTSTTHPVITDPLDTLLLARWRDMPCYRSRLRRVVLHLLTALATGEAIEVYAQTRAIFWYKAILFVPEAGALKLDTCAEHLERTDFARRIVQHRNLCRVSLNAVMVNWHTQGLWEASRPIAALLLTTWRDAERMRRQRAAP